MPQQCQFRLTFTLSAIPACGKDWPGSAMGSPPAGNQPGTDDLPLEETEGLARQLVWWSQAIQVAACSHDPSVFMTLLTGTGNSHTECQANAIDQFLRSMDPLLQVLAEQNVLNRIVTFDYPQSVAWIQIAPGVHLVIGLLRDDQGAVTTWELPYLSPSVGQIPIAVCVALRVHVELL